MDVTQTSTHKQAKEIIMNENSFPEIHHVSKKLYKTLKSSGFVVKMAVGKCVIVAVRDYIEEAALAAIVNTSRR
jgi:hypothetical protein